MPRMMCYRGNMLPWSRFSLPKQSIVQKMYAKNGKSREGMG